MTNQTRTPAFSFPAFCLSASVVLCVFEGAIRKWVYQNSPPLVQGFFFFAKDIPLAFAFFACVSRKTRHPLQRDIRSILALATALACLATLIVLDGLGTVGMLVSVRGLVILPWLAALVGPQLSGRRDIPWICHTVGICAVVNAIVGASQFVLPSSHFLNQQASSFESSVEDLGRTRASGTFAYITGMGDLCVAACWAGMTLLQSSVGRVSGALYVLAGLATGSAAISRFGVFAGSVVILLVLIVNRRTRNAACIGLAVVTIGYSWWGDSGSGDVGEDVALTGAIIARTRSADTFAERMEGTLSQLPDALARFPIGIGLGQDQNSQKTVLRQFEDTYEWDLARVVFEVGMLGLIATLLWRIAVPSLIWWYYFGSTKRVVPREMVPALCLLTISPVMTIVFDHLMATFFAVTASVLHRKIEISNDTPPEQAIS